MARTDLATVDPATRTYALVGQFLQGWALMESQLNAAIGKALGLDGTQQAIVCTNIQLRNKLHILKTALSLSFIPQLDKDAFTSMLNEIDSYSSTRNMMAHVLFGPSQDKTGVEFMVVKAHGKLDFPSTVWSPADFAEADVKLETYTDRLDALERQLQRSDIADALLKTSTVSNATAMGGLFGLGSPHALLHTPLADATSDHDHSPSTASDETSP